MSINYNGKEYWCDREMMQREIEFHKESQESIYQTWINRIKEDRIKQRQQDFEDYVKQSEQC